MTIITASGTASRSRTASPASTQRISLASGAAARSRSASATAVLELPDVSTDFTFTVLASAVTDAGSGTTPTPSAPLTSRRWQFEDPVSSDIYQFPINPQTATTTVADVKITESSTTTGQPISTEGTSQPVVWKVTGQFMVEAQYQAFVSWTEKPYRLYITDDLGRQFVVMITAFGPTIGKPNSNLWLSAYTLTMLILDQVTS